MASDTSDGIKFLISIDIKSIDYLHSIYGWDHLMVGKQDGEMWVKGFTEAELSAVEVKSIPNVKRFFIQNGKLYPIGKLLPVGNEPSLLWTPIKRGIFLELPIKNNNLFDVESDLQIKIASSKKEHKSNILMVDFLELSDYIESASSIRLRPLLWSMIGSKALVLGLPMLPIPGDTFWKSGSHILPAGFDFEMPILAPLLDSKINPAKEFDIIWSIDGSYSLIAKSGYVNLTRSSVRLTKEFSANHNQLNHG